MSSESAHLALLLDAPLQSWGSESRFQRRTTGLHPTKSGVIGIICAAMGLAKGSSEEQATLPMLAELEMTSILFPRMRVNPDTGDRSELGIGRLDDFHTVQKTRRASGSMNPDAVITRRQYLVDSRFGVILRGDQSLLERVAAKLQDPVWGVWLGRKHCIPAAKVFVALSRSKEEVWQALLRACNWDEGMRLQSFTVVTEVKRFDEGTDSLADQPLSFGDGTSSGPDKRQFAIRRIRVSPGRSVQLKE